MGNQANLSLVIYSRPISDAAALCGKESSTDDSIVGSAVVPLADIENLPTSNISVDVISDVMGAKVQ